MPTGGQWLGTWLSLGSPIVAELAVECGFEWLLLDLEHGFGSEETLLPQLLAARRSDTAVIVRVGAPHPDLILRVLDRGAAGIMVPHVNSVAEAEAIVQAAHYPPRGRRGYSRSTRAHRYGLDATPPAPPVIMAQIESIEGVENAAEIAAVDGVDVLFVGPADLKFDLQARPGRSRPDHAGCLAAVVAAATAHGKAAGILVRELADVEPLRKLGFTVLAVDSDLGILRARYQHLTQALKGGGQPL